MTLLTSNYINNEKNYILSLDLLNEQILTIRWSFLANLNRSLTEELVQLRTNQWNLIEFIVNLDQSKLTILKGRQILDQSKSSILNQLDEVRKKQFDSNRNYLNLLDKSNSLVLIGPIDLQQINSNQLIQDGFELKELHIDSPDTVKRRIPRRLIDLLDQIPTNTIREVSSVDFNEGGYVKYNFENRLRPHVNQEMLTINFIIPESVNSGLLWFAKNQTSKSYVYIKVSFDYFLIIQIS